VTCGRGENGGASGSGSSSSPKMSGASLNVTSWSNCARSQISVTTEELSDKPVLRIDQLRAPVELVH